MGVHSTGQGIDTEALTMVLKEQSWNAKDITVCPTSNEAKRFFNRFGFIIDGHKTK